jgi:hypothetical protein
MVNLNDEMEQLRKKFDSEKALLERKHEVLKLLIPYVEGYEPPFIHHSKLYGSVGSIHFKSSEYESLRKGIRPDKKLLEKLFEKFPPVPLVMVDESCKSFRPEEFAREIGERANISPVAPFTIRLETFQGVQPRLEWYAEINGELWRFDFNFSLHSSKLGHMDMKAAYYGGRDSGKVASWERCEIVFSDEARKVNTQRIRWASGSREYPNSFTIYWPADFVGNEEVLSLLGDF